MMGLEPRRADAVLYMSALVSNFAQIMVKQPDNVTVQSAVTGDAVEIALRVEKRDIHRIIGHKGNTASALRVILAAIGSKTKMKVTLAIATIECP